MPTEPATALISSDIVGLGRLIRVGASRVYGLACRIRVRSSVLVFGFDLRRDVGDLRGDIDTSRRGCGCRRRGSWRRSWASRATP